MVVSSVLIGGNFFAAIRTAVVDNKGFHIPEFINYRLNFARITPQIMMLAMQQNFK